MARPRRTEADRRQERAEASRRSWEQFVPKLEATHNLEDALRLVSSAPPPDAPGRKYYSNFGWFVQSLTPPAGANATELGLYIKFIQRLANTSKLDQNTAAKIEETLRQAMHQAS